MCVQLGLELHLDWGVQHSFEKQQCNNPFKDLGFFKFLNQLVFFSKDEWIAPCQCPFSFLFFSVLIWFPIVHDTFDFHVDV
jgi:hypothetical protein